MLTLEFWVNMVEPGVEVFSAFPVTVPFLGTNASARE